MATRVSAGKAVPSFFTLSERIVGLVEREKTTLNILFITLLNICSISEHDIYADLMREIVDRGHEVYIVSPVERRLSLPSQLMTDPTCENVHILKVKTGNIQKTNIIEKGISTILIEQQIENAIKKYLSKVRFDLILYTTPPITLVRPIKYIQKRDHAKTYLMLKDIFPQNAVDLGMMSASGLKGFLYRFFREKEKRLYATSDRIGCMSQANVDFVLKHNPEIAPDKVEICPNCIEVRDLSLSARQKRTMRERYGIPTDKKVFVYGGNLGKPQGISFIIECLRRCRENTKAFFLIVGDGTEYGELESFVESEKPPNTKLMKRLPKEDYDRMIASCDVGLIFLDHHFTIPNFPSRILTYMQVGLPVLAATDRNTDVGKMIVDGGFGCWCESNDTEKFAKAVESLIDTQNADIAAKELLYLSKYFSAKRASEIVLRFARNSCLNCKTE